MPSTRFVDIETLDTPTLFTRYLNVVNEALRSHEDEPPYAQILGAADRVLDGSDVLGVAIYSDPPSRPHERFAIRYRGGRFELVERQAVTEQDVEWKVQEEHLRNVVADPDIYVDQPWKLDFDWIRTRLGLG